MPEIINFVLSPQFLLTIISVLIALLLLKNPRTKQSIKKFFTQTILTSNTYDADSIQQISLIASDNSKLVLDRVRADISSIEIDKYIQIPTLGSIRDGIVTKSAISSAIGGIAPVGSLIAANPHGLFTATINPTLLTKFGDGTFSTMIHGSRGIVQNAGYQAVSGTVFAPLLIFQAVSIVTGQYYLNGITKQLDSIDRKIERLVKLHHLERLAKIHYSVSLAKKLSSINHPNIEDMLSLKMMQNEIGVIHEECMHHLSTLNLDDLTSLEKWRTSAKLEELLSKVNEASFDFYLNMAITTDEVLHLITIIEIVLNSRMSDHLDNRAKRLGELLQEVDSWDSQEFYRATVGDTAVVRFLSDCNRKGAGNTRQWKLGQR